MDEQNTEPEVTPEQEKEKVLIATTNTGEVASVLGALAAAGVNVHTVAADIVDRIRFNKYPNPAPSPKLTGSRLARLAKQQQIVDERKKKRNESKSPTLQVQEVQEQVQPQA